MSLPNSMTTGQSYSEWLGQERELATCYNCAGTGTIVIECLCGYEPEHGDKLCKECGRIVETEKCFKCNGEGKI